MAHFYFGILAVTVAITDIILAVIIYSKKIHSENYLGHTLILAAVVAISYWISAISENYFVMSLFSSLYFSSISVMLLFLMHYILAYTNLNRIKKNHRVLIYFISTFLVAFDVIINLINPFIEISIHYTFRPNCVAMWQYNPMFLYQLHLSLCYLLISAVFALLIFRGIRTPSVYRKKYFTILGGILFVVALNGIFLLFQNKNMLDYSILFYSLIGFYIFWNRYYYSRHGMLANVRQMILNELEQPVILFDRDDELVLHNMPAESFVKGLSEKGPATIQKFAEKFKFPRDITQVEEDLHFQWNPETAEHQSIYRVDIKRLRDKNHRTIGKLVVLTDNSLELDLLTGFHTKNTFHSHFSSENYRIKYPAAISICDLNKLSSINKNLGEEAGDMAILKLANLMRSIFPKESYFARMEDANLLSICPDTSSKEMRTYIQHLRDELEKITDFGQKLEIQSAVATATEEKPDIISAAETAMYSMRSNKLMDGTSSHSSLIDSLAQTLLESDNTTRDHVQRTREMGELLGKRLGFTDIQLSKLALLCLLHDIGKLGIPLEILNKPGKLNNAEWGVMKSHVEKGYRIAKASPELEDIADLILHHHESWNGKGYPDGLAQEAIPLLSRVIAVVDTYDAMTNDRPYHKAVSDREAREELKRCAGVQFDPSIVSEFIILLEQLHPLKNQPEEEKTENKELLTTPQGVSEIFNQPAETENIKPINYSRYLLNNDHKIITIDGNFEELTGYSEKDLETYNLTQMDLIPQEDRDSYMSSVAKLAKPSGQAYLEHRLLRKDGSIKHVICLGKMIFDSVTRQPENEIVVFDVTTTNAFSSIKKTERESAKRSYEKVENLMRRDSLTGLLNHESFINDVEMQLLKKDQINVLMILDVDYFKNYNDSFGHLAGDKMLSLVAVMLESAVKDYGFAGRLGGDEFAAIISLPSDTDKEKITSIVEQTFNTIMNTTSTQERGATISLGAARLAEAASFNQLYQAADRTLYRAKENGRKCFAVNL